MRKLSREIHRVLGETDSLKEQLKKKGMKKQKLTLNKKSKGKITKSDKVRAAKITQDNQQDNISINPISIDFNESKDNFINEEGKKKLTQLKNFLKEEKLLFRIY